MKHLAIVLFFFLSAMHSFGQADGSTPAMSPITAYRLAVTFNKTTNLVFPFSIKSVDKGSKDILAQKAKGVENILQLKAAGKDFDETNLTVVTADGKLYSFTVNYKENPEELNLKFGQPKAGAESGALFPMQVANEAEMEATAAAVAQQGRTIKRIRNKKSGMRMELLGIYIQNDLLYYQLKIENNSNVGYDISGLRLFIRDKKVSKRTAVQELEVLPSYVHGNTFKLEGNSESVLVYAAAKHTIPDKKYLAIQLMEKNGGRHLQLKVPNRVLVKARPL